MKIQDILDAAKPYGTRFQQWLGFILKWECEYDSQGNIRNENVAGDAGGLTFAGVDQRSHPSFNYANPRASDVAEIYFEDYWTPSQAQSLGFPVGEVVANFAVNMGLGAAVKLLQRSVNDMGGELKVDGALGPRTMMATKVLNACQLADQIENNADARYRSLATNNPTLRKFLAGWLNRDNALEAWWQGLKKSDNQPFQ